MLYIIYKDKFELEWHVGSPTAGSARALERVETIQADGDELEYILDRFTNIPHNVKKRVHVWTGDIARTIVANL